jgi:DNA-dependent metalloprotease WSS1
MGSTKAGPSNHTGAQTERKRKAGSRLTSSSAFQGVGVSLRSTEECMAASSGVGSGFRKKANSQKARLERARLAEERIKALQG